MSDPILASVRIPKIGREPAHDFRVKGGLHFIRGNKAPHFSLTYSTPWGGGAGHVEILARFPQFADLAALHLSDIDGVPMHAVANGWYWLAGERKERGAMGERYHGGNSKTPAECLALFAQHVRLPVDEARGVIGWIFSASESYGVPDARAKFAEWIDRQRPRWKAEAEACIAKHGLKVYGDPWPAQS